MPGVLSNRAGIVSFLFVALALLFADVANSQDLIYNVERSYVQKLGRTQPLREVLKDRPAPVPQQKLSREGKPSYVRNFAGRRQLINIDPNALPQGPDPLFNLVQQRNGSLSTEPLLVFEGMNQSEAFSGVPDVNGDVNSQYYIETVNATWLQVYDLQGNKVGDRFAADEIWSQVGRQSAGDPIILFDEQAQRWFMTEFPPQNEVLIAISDTEDPFGAWTAYRLSTPRFPDYPKYGIWPGVYVLTTNEGGGGLFFYAIDREAILAGQDTVNMQRYNVMDPGAPGFIVATPIGMIGDQLPPADAKPMIVNMNDDAWGTADEDRLDIYEMNIDWEDENNSTLDHIIMPTTPFDAQFCSLPGGLPGPQFACVLQPNGVRIDALPWVVMHRAVYRNFGTHESIVLNFAIDVTGDDHGGIRWMELRRVNGGEWTIYQEGTVGSDDGLNRFMGGISIDSEGNIGLAYSVSSEEVYPSLRFTGRFAGDPLGQMTIEEYEFATGKGSRNSSRFGDYASMSVDDQNIFWYAGEYIPNDDDGWSTKIVAFRIQKFKDDLGPTALVTPQDRPDLDDETVTVAIRNYGSTTQNEFSIGYIFDGGNAVIEDVVLDSLPPDSVYMHTFGQNIQFGDFGSYPLTIFTSMSTDTNMINDTCIFNVRKLTRNDAAIIEVAGIPGVICDTFIDGSIVLQNIGIDTLKTATLVHVINGTDSTFLPWAGSLLMDQMDFIPVTFSGLKSSVNELIVTVLEPNGKEDENESNNSVVKNLNVTPGGGLVTLELKLDRFPEETTWQLLDSNDNILFQGGPYFVPEATISEEWCLDYEQCYRFAIFDTYGDGIQVPGASGDFIIRNKDGIIVARLADPDFGYEDTTDMCPEYVCAVQVSAFVTHESTINGNNGVVTLIAGNGVSPYRFSSNGVDFQSSPTFVGLSPGAYSFLVVDAVGCEFAFDTEILECNVEWNAMVTDASTIGVPDGAIDIIAVNGNGPYQYRINSGSWQPDPSFPNLESRKYLVEVRDSVKCRTQDSILVGVINSIQHTPGGQTIKVFPNPSDGDFYIEIDGLEGEIFIDYEILDFTGRVLEKRTGANYSGVIKSYFTLYNRPAGTYFIRILHPKLNVVLPAIKY